MIYTDSQLKEKIVRMIESFENEVVEFKEARTNYSFNDIGKYFSALSNEANLRGLQEAWLIFGISDDKRYVGTEFRKQGSLQSLKKEIVNGTNERLTFLEIYELTMEKCRVIAFQIPPAIRGIPTTWQGAAYAREHESISPLPMNKVDLLRSQIGMDWSKEIVEDATIETLLEEYVDTEKDVVKGSIKQYQLDIIAKEIKSSLMTDVIVRELYKYEVIEEMAKFLDKDQRTAVHYIFNKIPKKKYYEICCKYLKENLSESNRKTEIEKGLRAWLAFLLWHGYSSEYIYRFLRNIFEESINDPEKKAQIFLNRFDFEIGKYKVYFVFYEKLKPYQKLLNERLHISFEDDGCFKQIKRKQKSFIGVMETKAYDNYSAMKRAYSALEIFLRYLEVFLNDNISVIGKNGLVIRQDTQEGIILPVKAFGYKSIKPEPRENFKTEIDTIVLGCQEKGKETYSQLNKIVDLHNAALNQQDLNDAFLNLWSALEVASVTDSSKSKIESVTDNIVSILQNDYFECIFSNILDDLKNNLGNRKVSLLLKDITEFDKEICKIAGFIFLEKYEKYREDYFANELKYYPNIRYKIYNLYEQRENREKLWHLSEKYCQRIEWHLYRLYRLRNAIVHAGESHKRIQMLGEHLHIYVDRVILELMVKLAKDKCLGTIQDVFTDTYLLLNKKKKNLKEPGNVDEQSIMLLLENFFIEE